MVDDDDNDKIERLTFNFYDEIRTAQRTPILNQKSIYGVDPLRDIATPNVSTANGEYVLACAGDGDVAQLDTAERCPYASGQVGEGGAGVRMASKPPAGYQVDFGIFGDDDGYFNRYTEDGLYAIVLRNGVENDPVLLGTWGENDRIDLENSSYLRYFRPLGGSIYQWAFAWYAYGPTEYDVQLARPDDRTGKWMATLGRTRPDGETSVADPQQPIRIRVTSEAGTGPYTVYAGGRQYSIVGPYEPIYRNTVVEAAVTGVDDQAWYPAFSIRRKSITPYALTRLRNLFIRATGDVRVFVELNSTIGTPSNFGDIPLFAPDRTLLEVYLNPDATQGTGRAVNLIPFDGGTQSNSSGGTSREPLPLIEDQNMTFYVRRFPGETTGIAVNVTADFAEFY